MLCCSALSLVSRRRIGILAVDCDSANVGGAELLTDALLLLLRAVTLLPPTAKGKAVVCSDDKNWLELWLLRLELSEEGLLLLLLLWFGEGNGWGGLK